MIVNPSEISFTIPSVFLWAMLAFSIIFFIIITVVLHHHWKYYGIHENPNIFVKVMHWVISIVLIILMTIALLIYESNL